MQLRLSFVLPNTVQGLILGLRASPLGSAIQHVLYDGCACVVTGSGVAGDRAENGKNIACMTHIAAARMRCPLR